MTYKLGKLPARPDSVKFKLHDYVAKLPVPPASFRHPSPPSWPMFGNDRWGDCVWAGAAHETQLWEHEGGLKIPRFTTGTVLTAYSEVTGFNANDPNTDQGTNMGDAAKYRRKRGIPDAYGIRHKVDAYVSVPLHSAATLKAAAWLFGGLGLGFVFYSHHMDEFKNHRPWSWQEGDTQEGGHYVCVIGYQNEMLVTVSWGREQLMTEECAMKTADEIIAYIDIDRLSRTTKLSPEGFNRDQLVADLGNLVA